MNRKSLSVAMTHGEPDDHASQAMRDPDGPQALLISRALDRDGLAPIVTNFERLAGKRPDEVPALQVGISHYGHSAAEYVRGCKRVEPQLKQLFEGATNLPEFVFALIRRMFPGTTVRLASYDGCEASPIRVSSWTSLGASNTSPGAQYLLAVHEDRSGVLPLEGFEIRDISGPLYVVLTYIRSIPNTNALRLFGFQYDPAQVEALGLTGRGYPVPAEWAEPHGYLDIPVATTDVVILRGDTGHAVVGANVEGRIAGQTFFGRLGNEIIVFS